MSLSTVHHALRSKQLYASKSHQAQAHTFVIYAIVKHTRATPSVWAIVKNQYFVSKDTRHTITFGRQTHSERVTYVIMNVEYISIDFLSGIAHQLPHRLAAHRIMLLKHSLIALRKENRFTNVYLWGRIDGIDKAYYIAFGYTDDCLAKRRYFYSQDCVEWFLLETWHKWDQIDNMFVWDMLQGDVSFIHRIKIVNSPMGFRPLKIYQKLNKMVKRQINYASAIRTLHRGSQMSEGTPIRPNRITLKWKKSSA